MTLSYVTKADLRRIDGQYGSTRLAKSLTEAQARKSEGTTFLSHSSKDDEFIPVVTQILEDAGATVYVDKKDPTLVGSSPRSIATILRGRIRGCKKFVLFASDNSKDSKWIPWELGISDGTKGIHNTAIFPAVENQSEKQWTEQEYLGVYDRIIWGDIVGAQGPSWIVWNQEENSAQTLPAWLRA